MPWLRLPSLGKRHREAASEPDRFLLVVKLATFLVVAGIVVGFLLVTRGGGNDEDEVTNPAIPTITDAGGSGPESESAPPPPPPAETFAAPAVGTQTAVIKPKAKPKPPRLPGPFRPGGGTRIGRIGKPCPQPGAIAFTRRFEPLVCRDGRWDRVI